MPFTLWIRQSDLDTCGFDLMVAHHQLVILIDSRGVGESIKKLTEICV